MDYDVWGNLNQETSTSESPFGFTGYIKDYETDLYYANARYYDSFTGRFLREDPLEGKVNNPPSLHRYTYGYANPTYFVDPDGRYAEDGHYYTTFIVAEALGFTVEEINTLALFSQLPDEVDSLDASVLVKRRVQTKGLTTEETFRKLDILHTLQGGDSEIETNRTIRAIIASKDNVMTVGILIHRLGDTFAHRDPNDESILFGKNIGHGLRGHTPDVIQNRPELYERYVHTLISTLAKVKGGVSDEELRKITKNVLAKTRRLSNAPTTYKKTMKHFDEYGGSKRLKTLNYESKKSNDQLTKDSIKEAKQIVMEVNILRAARGEKPINGAYEPDKSGPSLCCFKRSNLDDALKIYLSTMQTGSLSQAVGSVSSSVNSALLEAAKSLDATAGVPLDKAINANKDLIIFESAENKAELKP